MKQALHILKKDIRHLRWEICVLGALSALAAVYVIRSAPTFASGTATGLSNLVVEIGLPVTWFLVVAQAVFGEPLVGDSQAWLTMPYSWKSLLGAKKLLVLTTVNLISFAASCAILSGEGVSPLAHLGGLLWLQVVILAAIVLPVATLSALTRNFTHVLLAGLGTLVGLYLYGNSPLPHKAGGIWPVYLWSGYGWVRALVALAVMSVGLIGVLLLQYRTRRAPLARGIAVTVVLASLLAGTYLPFSFALNFAQRFTPAPPQMATVSIAIAAPGSSTAPPVEKYYSDYRRMDLGLRFSGLPPGTTADVDRVLATATLPGGARVSGVMIPTAPAHALHGSDAGDSWYIVQYSDMRPALGVPAAWHFTVYASIYGDAKVTSILLDRAQRRVFIPGAGVCEVTANPPGAPPNGVECGWPLRAPDFVAIVGTPDGSGGQTARGINPLPGWLGSLLMPATAGYRAYTNQPGLNIFTARRLGTIRREIDAPALTLGDAAHLSYPTAISTRD